MYTGEDIKEHNKDLKDNILKGFEDDIEKARKVGDTHPNGKWVWTEYKPGKFDWRGVKSSVKGSSSKKEPSKTQDIRLTELENTISSKKSSSEVKTIARSMKKNWNDYEGLKKVVEKNPDIKMKYYRLFAQLDSRFRQLRYREDGIDIKEKVVYGKPKKETKGGSTIDEKLINGVKKNAVKILKEAGIDSVQRIIEVSKNPNKENTIDIRYSNGFVKMTSSFTADGKKAPESHYGVNSSSTIKNLVSGKNERSKKEIKDFVDKSERAYLSRSDKVDKVLEKFYLQQGGNKSKTTMDKRGNLKYDLTVKIPGLSKIKSEELSNLKKELKKVVISTPSFLGDEMKIEFTE